MAALDTPPRMALTTPRICLFELVFFICKFSPYSCDGRIVGTGLEQLAQGSPQLTLFDC
jgi:hypothetical protein